MFQDDSKADQDLLFDPCFIQLPQWMKVNLGCLESPDPVSNHSLGKKLVDLMQKHFLSKKFNK